LDLLIAKMRKQLSGNVEPGGSALRLSQLHECPCCRRITLFKSSHHLKEQRRGRRRGEWEGKPLSHRKIGLVEQQG